MAVDQKEYSLRHMRGRYAFSVACLSWIERKARFSHIFRAAAVFYSTPPTATLGEALEDFLSGYAEKPEWIENLMFIARVYLAKRGKVDDLPALYLIHLGIQPVTAFIHRLSLKRIVRVIHLILGS
ncbi:hypothetical protein KIN20_007193 [Parelaphostrongylus tenuis]|uniref:Uncharacterized protein n=1 Tax=Parelaphostrongylus tenuis TaxID=148309 RepID=A0AAD5QIY9_PARTN|nr:hypothetical protein KIN20_007193 [Parelaphostrongylus tenuis]